MAEEIERLEDHDIAAVFPLLPKAELEDLAKDIRANGLRQTITLYEGKILDGRNRYRALLTIPELANDLDPEWDEEGYFDLYQGDDPLGFVASVNMHRRHLTESQRAAIANELAKLQKGRPDLGKTNINASIEAFNEDTKKEDASIDSPSSVTQEQAAKLLNVSRASVQRAKAIKEADPELHAKVKSGEVSLNAAYKQIKPASEPEPPRSWTAPEVNTEEDGEVSEETSKDLAAKEPINPTKRQFNFQLKKFIREMCELFKVPKKEIEENIKEYFLAKDKHQ